MPMRVGLPSHPYSFLIEKRGNLIVAQDSKGRIQYSGTDAASVIQSAINALPEFVYPYGGGSIYIKSGVYTINKKIVVDRPLKLEGDGRYGRTVLYAANGLNNRLLEVYKSGADFWSEIRNLWFEGNKDNQTAGDYLLYFEGGYPIVENVYVMRAYQTGIYVHAQDFHFKNVYVEFCGKYGWEVYCGQNGHLDQCTSWDNQWHGIYLNGKRVELTNCRVMMNGPEGTYAYGLFANAVQKLKVLGGWYQENAQYGIALYNCSHVSVIGATVRDNSQRVNNGYSGIYIYGSSNYVKVIGCDVYSTLTNKQSYGIEEGDTADYNIIVGNAVHDNVSGQIRTIGAHTIVANNIS
jgi:hypothetical protein